MNSLKKQLDEDEKRELRQGRTPPHAVSASTFINSAIHIEEQQYVPPLQRILKIINLSH
jgi:hypothetical protein